MPHLTQHQLQELSDKWLSGTISAEELELLEAWYNQPVNETIDWETTDADEETMGERLFKNIDPPKRGFILKNARLKKRAVYAAGTVAILLILATVLNTPYLKKTKNTTSQVQAVHVPNNKVVLTLADGSKVFMDTAGKGLVAKQGNISVSKTKSGELVYSVDKSATNPNAGLNAISTPVGGQFEVHLADGTRVWLNALSTLKFPTAFSGKTREVELTGEAYFEVAKNKEKPFKVMLAKNTTVQVLGTHFAVMAYADESRLKATLLEGAIRIKKDDLCQLIKPGQQASIDNDIEVSEVNAEEAISWQKGLFSFDKTDTRDMMRQISRWYGAEVVYLGKTPVNRFTGYIPRSSSLNDVLKMVKISGLQTTLQDNKITVINN